MMKDRRLRAIIIVFLISIVIGFLMAQRTFARFPVLSFVSEKLHRVDLGIYDVFMNAQPVYDPSDRVILVTMDSTTEDKLGTFPWKRRHHAKVIDNLKTAGAGVIVFDVDFSSKGDKEDDRLLAEAADRAKNVIVAAFLRIDDQGKPHRTVPYDELYDKLMDKGTPQANRDLDTVVRSIPIFNLKYREFACFDPLSLVAVRNLDHMSRTITFSSGDSCASVDDLKIPLEQERSFLINYSGKPFSRISYLDVVENTFDKTRVRGKIVIILSTVDPRDQFRVPRNMEGVSSLNDNLMFGGEIHANAVQTLLEKRFIHHMAPYQSWLVGILLCGLGVLALLRLNYLKVIPVFFAIVIIFFYICQYLFVHSHLWVDVAFPSVMLALFWLGVFVVESHRIKQIFVQFVPKQVAEKMISSSKESEVGGKTKVATVLFSDIRSYSTLSEGKDPEKVMELLNEYHHRVGKLIEKNNGSIIFYAGDGTMAVFGVPDDLENHAIWAVRAAVEMQKAAEKMSEETETKGFPPIRIGVGICTGQVAYGVVGQDALKHYTAIGDTVNTAARLQGMSDQLQSPIVITEGTQKEIESTMDSEWKTEDLGEVPLKGKSEKVKVFRVSY